MKQRKDRNQYTIAWYSEEFPCLTQQFQTLVKRKATREQGAFRAVILSLVEDGLRKEIPIKTPLDRVEEKLDELIYMLRQVASLTISSDVIQADEGTQETGLSQEDRDRLNKMLSM